MSSQLETQALLCQNLPNQEQKIPMVRLVLRWVDSPWAFELHPGLNRLGRNPTNDFRISDPSVSSFHAEIFVDGSTIRLSDVGSTNGTFIDGARVAEGFLTPANELRLGSVRLKLEEVMVTAPTAVPNPAAAPVEPTALPLPQPALSCVNHAAHEAEFQCENCGRLFCQACVKIVGHDRLRTMTVCPNCHGQCDHLQSKEDFLQKNTSIFTRLAQTLKIPFIR